MSISMIVKLKIQENELPIEEDEEHKAMEEPVSTLVEDQPMSEVAAPTMETPADDLRTIAFEDSWEFELSKDCTGNQPATQAFDSTTQASGHDAQF